jgi:glycosyltransferase involved in cell wall biosynthesis
MKISLLLPSFRRAHLLELGLYSITRNPTKYDLEIIVLNDGLPDETENVCKKFPSLNIKYVFTGKRNLNGTIVKRPPSFAQNIGLKQSAGDIIILSGPEIFHLNRALDILVDVLIHSPKSMIIPDFLYFDKLQHVTNALLSNRDAHIDIGALLSGSFGRSHVEMPFLMALYKEHLMTINGLDEDLTGYAADDNDLILRLKRIGLNYIRTPAQAIHLWHEESTDGGYHFENPAWVHNWNIYQAHVNDTSIIKVNLNREWGKLDV